MAIEDNQKPTPDNSQETDTIEYRFNEANMGHRLRDFDRDQAMLLGFGRLAGLVDPQAAVHFTPRISDEELQNNHALNIEGFAIGRANRPNLPNANSFTNDPATDNPA